jgi:oxygen-dependent protoporphyrinogen oxidase
VSPGGAAVLPSIAYVSVGIVTLALDEDQLARPLTGSGYLVPRAEQRTITACSFGSVKWPQWRVPGQVILRASVGRDGDQRALELDDGELAEAVRADLERQLGLRGGPKELRITRWWHAMPQYAPGHVARVDHVMAAVTEDAPGVFLAGAAYKGLGLPACIAQGQAASRAALATVGRR